MLELDYGWSNLAAAKIMLKKPEGVRYKKYVQIKGPQWDPNRKKSDQCSKASDHAP